MATKKKAAAKPAAKAKAALKAAAKGGAKGAAPAAKKGKGGLWVTLILVLVLGGLATQTYLTAKKQAALKFDYLRVGAVLTQGEADGQFRGPWAMACDPQGNLFAIDGPNDAMRLQKFGPQSNFLGKYKPANGQQALAAVLDMASDENGVLYLLTNDASVRVIDNNLKFLRLMKLPVNNATGLAADQGKIYVTSRNDNKVQIFDVNGNPLGEFGAPGTKSGDIAAPMRIAITHDGRLAVLEDLPDEFRIKVFSPEYKMLKSFRVPGVKFANPVRMATDNRGLLHINDHLGSKGIVIYDLAKGKLVGEVKGTTDGVLFPSPGSIAANRFTGVIYVHTGVGAVPSTMPSETK